MFKNDIWAQCDPHGRTRPNPTLGRFFAFLVDGF